MKDDAPERPQISELRAFTDESKHRQVQSFLEYSDSTSWLRVFTVCASALVPSFACVILIELLPLQPPSEGWKANWIYCIRLFLTSFILSFGLTIQTNVVAPAIGLKPKHALFIAVGTSIAFVGEFILLAHYWRFSVPFFMILGNPGWLISWHVCLFLTIGVKKWRAKPEIKMQLGIAMKIGSIQAVLVLLYPGYNALFLRLHGLTQMASVLMLPVIKYVIKRLFTRALAGIPGATAFGMVNVELFDALYLFKCMQAASSTLSEVALITIDLLQNIYHLRCLRKRVQDVKRNLARMGLDSNNRDVVWASMSKRSRSVVPAPFLHQSAMDKMKLNASVQELVLDCEHIVMVEYIECVTPMLYVLYLVFLFHSPNAKYYPETKHIDAAKLWQTVRNIATYAALEFLSLMYMHVLLVRQFNISALHLLANVLERDRAMLQSIFAGWLIIVLQFTLEHGGVDYSFRFLWS